QYSRRVRRRHVARQDVRPLTSMRRKIVNAISAAMGFNVLVWLTMLTCFAAIVCLAAAADLALATVLTPALAALVTGVGLLVVCLLLILAMWLAVRATAVPPPADKPRQGPSR